MLTPNPAQNIEPHSHTSTPTQSTKELSCTEEKIVRMRHGLSADDSMPLISLSQEHPELAKQLEAIEQQVRASATAQ